jgi:hypothetical protein
VKLVKSVISYPAHRANSEIAKSHSKTHKACRRAGETRLENTDFTDFNDRSGVSEARVTETPILEAIAALAMAKDAKNPEGRQERHGTLETAIVSTHGASTPAKRRVSSGAKGRGRIKAVDLLKQAIGAIRKTDVDLVPDVAFVADLIMQRRRDDDAGEDRIVRQRKQPPTREGDTA